jgi:hypothetical protein
MADESDDSKSVEYATRDFPSHVARRNPTVSLTAHGNPIGRPPGALNKNRGEAKTFCQEILRSEEYKHSVRMRAKAGTLPAQVEVLLWHYAYGKPVEHVAIATAATSDLSELSTEQLAERAAFIAGVLRDTSSAKEAAAALDREISAEADAALVAAPTTGVQ